MQDLERALAGRLAIEAAAGRAGAYLRAAGDRARAERPRPRCASTTRRRRTRRSSRSAAADAIGVLYRITQALAELDLDIRHAKVQTLGHEVVDAFYVRDRRGQQVTDAVLPRRGGAGDAPRQSAEGGS